MSQPDDLCFYSATELTKAYGRHTLSPVEVCQAVLERIDTENPVFNAMCLVDHERAILAACESEARWLEGKPLSPIDGVPATVKDLILTRDWPTRRGSLTTSDAGDWTEDAPAVDKLRKAGAILLGKTTTPEFGSKGVTDNRLTGITRNAHDPSRTAGGSSGGAGVAAARGWGVLHIGTDGAGSVRIPASYNGVFGLKPTFGRIPAFPASPQSTVAHLGPMTRDVMDAALMLNAMAQPDSRDWQALPASETDYASGLDQPLKGLRVAYSPDLGYADVALEVASICANAVLRFEKLGADVEEIEAPLAEDPAWITDRLWFFAYTNICKNMSTEMITQMDHLQQAMLGRARALTATDVMEAQTARDTLGLRLNQLFDKYDLLITPTMPQTAFAAGQDNPWGSDDPYDWIRWSPFTYPFNLSQQPAATVPCGLDRAGFPVGLQIVGRKYADHLVLRACHNFYIGN